MPSSPPSDLGLAAKSIAFHPTEAALQDEYIRGQDLVVVDGFVGHAGPYRTPARLVIEKANANIAGMQRFLYYDPVEGDGGHDPEITIIYTPNLAVPGYPNDR